MPHSLSMTGLGHVQNVEKAVRRIAGVRHRHPGLRSPDELTRGERAADKMRNGMGSWAFVIGSLIFLAVWMTINVVAKASTGKTFDAYPFILLNLVLSCVAALQGAILLIAAKRSDQLSNDLAQHDYEADCQSRELLETLTAQFDLVRVKHDELHDQNQQLTALVQQILARG
jgi:uncharacterized membrane protein